MAEYSDWEINTTSQNVMQQAVNTLGFTQGDGFLNTSAGPVRYTIYIYGTKYVNSGQTRINAQGDTVPIMTALPGWYAILRWFSPTPFPPPEMHIPNNVTIIPLPADSPHVFAS